jgi:hypothetical protein
MKVAGILLRRLRVICVLESESLVVAVGVTEAGVAAAVATAAGAMEAGATADVDWVEDAGPWGVEGGEMNVDND